MDEHDSQRPPPALTLYAGEVDPHGISGLYVRQPSRSHHGRPIYQHARPMIAEVSHQFTAHEMSCLSFTDTLLYYCAPTKRERKLCSPGPLRRCVYCLLKSRTDSWCMSALQVKPVGSWMIGNTLGSEIGSFGPNNWL